MPSNSGVRRNSTHTPTKAMSEKNVYKQNDPVWHWQRDPSKIRGGLWVRSRVQSVNNADVEIIHPSFLFGRAWNPLKKYKSVLLQVLLASPMKCSVQLSLTTAK